MVPRFGFGAENATPQDITLGDGAGGGERRRAAYWGQGLTLAHLRAQLQDLRDTLLTSELNLSTFGTHPRVEFGHMGDKVSLS
jgi:hypothetical protein